MGGGGGGSGTENEVVYLEGGVSNVKKSWSKAL